MGLYSEPYSSSCRVHKETHSSSVIFPTECHESSNPQLPQLRKGVLSRKSRLPRFGSTYTLGSFHSKAASDSTIRAICSNCRFEDCPCGFNGFQILSVVEPVAFADMSLRVPSLVPQDSRGLSVGK
jgi:hypothetical protein